MSGRPRVLVVEDDPAIRRLVCRALELSGYASDEASDAGQALALVEKALPDAIVLDLGLPDRDGRDLLPLLKQSGAAVLVLTARDEIAEKVSVLDAGADDYVTKPFHTDELLARVRMCLRHKQAAPANSARIAAGELLIDLDRRHVMRNAEEIHLTPKEYELLAELAQQAGRVLTHSHLLRAVWGPAHQDDVEYLRVTVRALRRKLERNPAQPMLIRNEPGVGYRLQP
jgi:two-component system KDP operon response regulator KdpE